jgi:hypothetical protein
MLKTLKLLRCILCTEIFPLPAVMQHLSLFMLGRGHWSSLQKKCVLDHVKRLASFVDYVRSASKQEVHSSCAAIRLHESTLIVVANSHSDA